MTKPKIFDLKFSPADRRKFIRVNIYTVTRYFCPTCDQDVGVQTLITDLSEGGAMLVTFDKGIPLGMKVKMTFLLPHTEQVALVEGMIRHTAPLDDEHYRAGVEFTKVKRKGREAIAQYIALNLRECK